MNDCVYTGTLPRLMKLGIIARARDNFLSGTLQTDVWSMGLALVM